MLSLDPGLFKHYGDQFEIERSHEIGGRPGTLRFLAFRNRARMSRFRDAMDLAVATGTTPDINAVRHGEWTKTGIGINLEQEITGDVGLFVRASRADGKTETYAFTEIDHSLSGGLLVKGGSWNRGADTIGIALARNGLSSGRRTYLSAGGLGFFIGDGRLTYRPELIFETFYKLAASNKIQISLDWQHITRPAYNADRGPVNVFALRLHFDL